MAQPLAAATSTRPMRIRSPTEVEPAVYPVVSSSPRSSVSLVRAKEVLSDVQQVRLRSVSSVVECIIEFVNTSDVSVWAVWLDFAGNEVQYTMIEAKGKRRYRTFQSHPWIVRAVHNGQRMMLDRRMVVIGRGGEQSVKITTPPQLLWSFATHTFYPEEFKAQTRSLLLAHHRQRCDSHQIDALLRLPSTTAAAQLQPQPPPSPFARAMSMFPDNDAVGMSECSIERGSCSGLANVMEGDENSSVPLLFSKPCMAAEGSLACSLAPSSTYASSMCLETLCSVNSACLTLAPSSCWGEDCSLSDLVPSREEKPRSGPTPHVPRLESTSFCHPAAVSPAVAQLDSPQPASGSCSLARPSASHPPCNQQQSQDYKIMQPMTPRTHNRATRMLGWVVEKVVKMACSPMRAPPPQLSMSKLCPMTPPPAPHHPRSPAVDTQLGSLMADLPDHLVLHIIQLMAPADVPQCVSWGKASGCPDVHPALLITDPATWPSQAAPQEEADAAAVDAAAAQAPANGA
ncbi:hypothetical protein V8C86DRAFT_88791 [Haematococcus lacustris]